MGDRMFFTYTAQEAHDASVSFYEERLEKNRMELNSLIKDAVSRGEFSVIYDRQTINNAYGNTTKQILNQLGYKVVEQGKDDKKVWVISWETPGVIE